MMRVALGFLLTAGCATEGGGPVRDDPVSNPGDTTPADPSTPTPPGTTSAPAPEPLSLRERVIRISLAVRGLRPGPDELALVEGDPAALEGLVDGWMTTPEFAEVVRDLHAELTLVRADAADQLPSLGPATPYSRSDLYDSHSEAPLKLAEEIVLNDLPYSTLVTADFTMADPAVAAVYGLPYDPEGPTWQRTQWQDGRPHAGLISDSGLWRRHISNANNFHRARANIVSSLFLCDDISRRHVEFGELPITADTDAVADALMNDPTCVACHQVLDPLAAYLWGFKRDVFAAKIITSYEAGCTNDRLPRPDDLEYVSDYCYPLKFFIPANEDNWSDFGLRPPGFYGTEGRGMDHLGQQIAADPRFPACTARRFAGWFYQAHAMDLPTEVVEPLRQRFVDSGLNARALIKAIVLSETFALRGVEGSTTWSPPLQATRPEQLARIVRALTGFEWRIQPQVRGEACEPRCSTDVDLLLSDSWGYRSLAGGVDGKFHPLPTHAALPSKVLTWDRFATEAAAFVVAADLAQPDRAQRRLLRDVDELDEAGPAVVTQLRALHEVVLNETLNEGDVELEASLALFEAALDQEGTTEGAWTLVLSALFQDPRMAWY